MVDLFETGVRPNFRMSESGACALVIGHRIVGTPNPMTVDRELPMLVGTALEPVINQVLTRKYGLDIAFGDADQLELAAQDPYRTGHPDGFITLREATPEFKREFPMRAQTILLDGGVMLLEDKTMSDGMWRTFTSTGLISSPFLKKYLDQAQQYMGTVSDRSNDELWERSNDFRAYMRQHKNQQTVEAALVVGYNTSTKKIAFEVVERDPEHFARIGDRLEREVAIPMHNGEMPAPTFDGKSPDCFLCDYKNLCPAAMQARRDRLVEAEETDFLDSLPIGMEVGPDRLYLDELSAEYNAVNEELKGLGIRKKELADKIKAMFTETGGLVTPGFRVSISDVKGRRTIDTKALETLAETYGFELPYKTGKPTARLSVKPLFGPSFDGDKDEE